MLGLITKRGGDGKREGERVRGRKGRDGGGGRGIGE